MCSNNINLLTKVDLLALKAMSTLFFAALAASVYFTPYYLGTGGSWSDMIDAMVDLPSWDLLDLGLWFDSMVASLQWPDLPLFEMPLTFSLSVVALQYSSEAVWWLQHNYLSQLNITENHFFITLLPVRASFAFGRYAYNACNVLWDCGFSIQFCCVFKCVLAEDEHRRHRALAQGSAFSFPVQITAQYLLDRHVDPPAEPHMVELWIINHRETTTLRWNSMILTALPESIGNLQALTMLDLTRCTALTALPESIGNLQALTTLDLSDCEALTALPESIGNLQALTTLDLSDCEALTALPESMGNLQALTTLDLSVCKALTALPESIGNLQALRIELPSHLC
jgi:Leucine-rich repeat (LRR) protein